MYMELTHSARKGRHYYMYLFIFSLHLVTISPLARRSPLSPKSKAELSYSSFRLHGLKFIANATTSINIFIHQPRVVLEQVDDE